MNLGRGRSDLGEGGRVRSRPPDAVRDLLAEEMRASTARRLALDARLVKPCVAMIPPQGQGQRSRVCHILAVELLKAGAAVEGAAAYLGEWASNCAQPPAADHPYTSRDVESTVRGVGKLQTKEGLRGYGCRDLEDWCAYGGYEQRHLCPYYRSLSKAKAENASLVGALDIARQDAPSTWSQNQTLRRRWLMVVIAGLEVLRGRPGGLLITTQSELSWRATIPRKTVGRDLAAMAEAGWIDYTPGLSRRETAGRAPVGSAIRRLTPVDRMERTR
jgi:hypothetical protein